MFDIEFEGSADFSVGMEMEFQLLDSKNLDLTNRVEELLPRFDGSAQVQPEFIQNTVELTSSPAAGIAELDVEMRALAARVATAANQLSMNLAGAGTHSFSQDLAVMTDRPRYREMHQQYGYTAHNQITFATHVHLGVPNAAEAMLLMAELKTLLPVFIALSANSPFWRGYDTRYAAYRQRVLASSRTYGQPPALHDWQEFCIYIQQSIAAGVLESVHDIHWDIRPRPHLGTVELRVMDNQTTVSEALALAAFLRAAVGYMRRTRGEVLLRPIQPVEWWVHKDNCFLASRDGIDARVIVDVDGRYVWLADVVDELLDACAVEAEALGETRWLAALRGHFENSDLGYQRQRAVRDGGGNCMDVVAAQRDELLADIATASANVEEEAKGETV